MSPNFRSIANENREGNTGVDTGLKSGKLPLGIKRVNTEANDPVIQEYSKLKVELEKVTNLELGGSPAQFDIIRTGSNMFQISSCLKEKTRNSSKKEYLLGIYH